MEDTQDLSARMTKLQENVLRWEHLFQSEAAGPTSFRQARWRPPPRPSSATVSREAECVGLVTAVSRSSTYESWFNRNDGIRFGTGISARPRQ